MPDGASLDIDISKLDRDSDRLIRGYLGAGTKAVVSTTKRLERRLEAATQAAVPGRLYRAWQSSNYPKSGPAREPSGIIWLKGGPRTRGAIQFWSQPGEIRGKEGQYLAVPLPAAGPRGRLRDLTPVEWEAAHNVELRPVFRPGRAPLLVADNGTVVGAAGQAKPYRPITRRRTLADQRRGFVRGATTVPIFVLLPLVKFRNAFAVDPLVVIAEGELVMAFFAAVRGVS